ncbi:hypothetical protein J3B02_005426 [Coemansia erecta]|uniref:Uncharacterized protein n=1 Tax=Coemansia asiatica TaxID=1052880 RepID=A0A9W7XKK3_9FUNG|nr:hypothetical protein LPJ64_003723 [Coemansia asiatica]KAJ2842935.1 hypothetical protein J3B02_005426 [Coemansia erecta]KAJ2862702.1 hypothetical protein FB639_005360 [Coemansia asiatica]
MSEMSGRPWLEKIFASKSLELNEKRQKVGRPVQLILIQETDDKKYPVICEISDKKNYMRAALSRKLVKKLEKATNKSAAALQGANAVVVDFIPKLFDPLNKHAGESRVDVPVHVKRDNNAQFWMLITNLSYMGGDGNGTFDEPVFINTSPHVTKRMQAYLLLKGRSGYTSPKHESGMHVDHADVDVEMIESDTENDAGLSCSEHVHKKQRIAQDRTQTPTAQFQKPPVLGQIPFIVNADIAWQSETLWESLVIQQACVPLMRLSGLLEQEEEKHVQQRDDLREAPINRRVSAADECQEQEPSLAAFGGVQRQGHRLDPQPPRAEKNTDTRCQERISGLGRLLEPEGHGCVDSLVMMERFYGPEESSSPPVQEIDSPMADLLNADGHSLLDDADRYWDQASPLVIHSQLTDS